MKKLLVAVIILMTLAAVGVAGYFGYTQIIQSKAAALPAQTGTTLPSSFTNPFIEKPTSGFGAANASVVVSELFTEPSPTPYENPFGASASAEQPYQNPFEALQ